jgi:hypothetical protein
MSVTLLLSAAAPGAADYQSVAEGVTQWLWTQRDAGAPPMTAATVRPDGWLVVATSERFASNGYAGGELLIVPPWGGPAAIFGDPPDKGRGATHSYLHLVSRGDRLFGLTSMPDQYSDIGQKARLVEIDARTGHPVADHGAWWFPDLDVDPQTGDLVLWNFRCTGTCGPGGGDDNEETVGAVTHQLVWYDPDTRATTQVLLADPGEARIGGSGTCEARRDATFNCDDVFRVAFSNDGNTMFLGTARNGANAIDVRDRRGALRYTIAAPRAIDAMVYGRPGTCFADALLMSAADGSAWVLRDATNPAAARSSPALVAVGAPAGTSHAALTPSGEVVNLRRSEAVVLACPGFAPPAPPRPALAPAGAGGASVAGAAPPTPAPASPPAPNIAQPPVPPQAPPAPPAAGPPAHAAQLVSSVSAGVADAPEEQPVYGLSAARRHAPPPAWARLGVGAGAVTGMAAVAFVLLPTHRRVALARRPS